MSTEKFTVVRFPCRDKTEQLPAPAASRDAAWISQLNDAVAANLARPAMSGTDPLTECLLDESLAFSYARERARSEPNAIGVAGPVIVPVGRVARWWLSFKNWV